MPEQPYIAVVCPSEDKTDRKNRTPDAERKWRKRHGLPPVKGQGKRGPGKAPRVDRQEVARAVARVIVGNPIAPATILAQLAGLIREDADEKEREAVVARVRRALQDLQQMPGLAGDEKLAEAVRQAFMKREEEKERRRQELEQKTSMARASKYDLDIKWLMEQQAIHAAEMSKKMRVAGMDLLKWAGSAYELNLNRNKYICTLEPTSWPADLPLMISTLGNIPVASGFKKGKGGGKKAVGFPTQTEL
ncbi:hypothetical protein MGLY_27540 [Neomoorella glycerini]|uniref:Uncharacterized protein n=1 Tax=Neomoorella glycerini TaxID=55779 RepID=A0A6I5ZUX7_9FIRM|nr:hypothetical protein [Moorella glycerini]QGP93347.1 hypothetical protein MGLY_27540 [Moorella glycerini]